MMRRESIIAHAVTALTGALTGVVVELDREVPIGWSATDTRNRVNVCDDGDEVVGERVGSQQERLTLAVEGYVAPGAVADLRSALHDLSRSAYVALVADRTRGGVANDTRKRALTMEPGRRDFAGPVGGFVLTMEVDYFTHPDDPSVGG